MALTVAMSLSTMEGSASVEVSPSLSASLHATLHSTRRIISPERVLGSPETTTMPSRMASPPIYWRTDILSEGMRSGVSATPSARMTYAKTPWPLTSCGASDDSISAVRSR